MPTEAEQAAINRAQCPPIGEWPTAVLDALSAHGLAPDHYFDWVVWVGWTESNCIRPHWDLDYIAEHADAVRVWVAPA